MANGTKNGTKKVTYPKSLQQILGQPQTPGVFGYGFSQDDIQQLQDAGITPEHLMSLGLSTQPQATTSAYQSGGQGGPTASPSAGGIQQSNNATLLQAMLKLGGQQQQAQPQPPTWNQVGQAAGLSPADISQFQTMNRTPADIARQFSVLGPQSAGLSPQQFQFQVPQQVVPTPVTGQPVVPAVQPVQRFQSGGLVTGNWDWPKVGQAAGLSQADITTFQQQGLTPDQAAQRFGLGASPPQPISQGQPASLGGPSTGTTSQMMKAGGAMAGQATPTDQELFSNPMYGANALGAAALQMPMVVNAQPSGQPSAKSGVANVSKAIVSQGVPIVPGQGTTQGQTGQAPLTWAQLAQANQLGGADIAELQKTGLTPDDLLKGGRFGLNLKAPQATQALAGPWSTQPGIFVQAARTAPTAVTPLQAAVQPTATAYNPAATAFAQAPPAPGIQIPQTPLIAAHTNALEEAGKALFAHFGGDPNTATPAHIAQFHSELQSAAAGGPPIKARSGGLVPGRGNQDTVPALLTPGEYVIPKDQVAQFFGGRPPVKMAAGGYPPDDDQNQPSEARRQRLTAVAAQSSQTPPAAPGGGFSSSYSSLASGLTTAAQTYANSLKSGTASGGGMTAAQFGTAMGKQGTLGDEAMIGSMGLGGRAGMSSGMQSGLSGIGSGLTQASKDIAASAPPWQMQQNAIPAPPPAPAAPQLTQPQVAQQTQQGVNPYVAYAANQARYPTSPYYT